MYSRRTIVRSRTTARCWSVLVSLPAAALPVLAAADTTPGASITQIGPSLFRMLGAFALVMAVGFGLLWLLRRGIRLGPRGTGAQRKLNVLEVRMLGNRQSLFVVGYQDQRMLLASTPTGVNFLAHLPSAPLEAETSAAPAEGCSLTFAEALQHAFARKA